MRKRAGSTGSTRRSRWPFWTPGSSDAKHVWRQTGRTDSRAIRGLLPTRERLPPSSGGRDTPEDTSLKEGGYGRIPSLGQEADA